MGIGMIMSIIMGIVMTTMLGASIGPNVVEQMKIKKVENKTIGNQVAIKGAIDRYIVLTGEYPKDFDDLKSQELLKDYHEDNLFSGGYSFVINEEKGTLIIYTQFDDDKAGNYFKNSFKTSGKPTCVEKVGEACKDNLYETFYFLPIISMEKGNELDGLEVGSKEYIEKAFTKKRLGNKEYFEKNPLKDGDKDYVYVAEDKVEEFIYDKINNEWVSNGEKVVGGLGKSSGVEIENVEVPNARIEGDYRIVENVPYEKVICNENSLGQEVFVVNENTKLGEIVYVAETKDDAKTMINNGFIANNICTTNITDMYKMFDSDSYFNQPLNRWDVSNVNNMYRMFKSASKFNQDLNAWNTSNVGDMSAMFNYALSFNSNVSTWNTSKVKNMSSIFLQARNFNQPLNAWNTTNVKNMRGMFDGAGKFNQPLNTWDTSKVNDMLGMFRQAKLFNQPLNAWNVSNVNNMQSMFERASLFNQDLNTWKTSNVEDMMRVFRDAESFNGDISSWNTSKVKDMDSMFDGAIAFNQNLSSWNICGKSFSSYDAGTTSWKPSFKPRNTCP